MKKLNLISGKTGISAVAFGVCLALSAGGVFAQQSAGSVSVRAAQGSTVVIDNKELGISRTLKIGAGGSVQVSQLPSGTYTVTLTSAAGKKETRTVSVLPGEDALASFETLGQVVVTVKSLDVQSTESAQTLTKTEIDRIPVSKNVTSVTLLAPGANQGDSRLGETGSRSGFLPSLGGASVAENAYYINGFNVTNIVNGVAYNQVPFEAIADISVKTGGYGAEYGRSLGGVISVNTKRGTNEWHGGVSASTVPGFLQGSSVYTDVKNPTTGLWDVKTRPGGTRSESFNVWGSGPIVPEKLYFFGLVQAGGLNAEGFGFNRQSQTTNSTPQYLAKLDWNLTRDNRLEFTSFSDRSTDKVKTWVSPTAYQTAKGDLLSTDTFTYGGTNNILKYTSWINDDFNISALYGVGNYARESNVQSAGCPIVQDRTTSPTTVLGCYSQTTVTVPDARDKREAFRLDAEYTLGKHKFRGGLDRENYTTVDGTEYSGGGTYYLIYNLNPGSKLSNGYVNNTGAVQKYVRTRTFINGGTFLTKNSAWYVEDNIQATKNLLLNIGIRNEQFTNFNGDGIPFVDVKNTWAPRMAATWDVTGKQDLKVFSNLGRYYIPVYANTNVRLAGQQTDITKFYQYAGAGTAPYNVPLLGQQLGGDQVTSDGSTPDPRTVVDTNLKPMFQDELILGFQKALSKDWSYGVKWTHRNLKNGMDDVCNDEGAYNWAVANGYSAAQADAIATAIGHCFLTNPGRDLHASVDLNGTGALSPVTVPAAALGNPLAMRKYDALEFTLERAWDRKWNFKGSYVYSLSRGNTEGYVKSDNGQDDAGITQDFDYPGLMEGAKGFLPNDRRHTVKLWGSYAVSNEWRLGGSLLVQSGRPINCFGYYNGTQDTVSILYGASSFYCAGVLNERGSLGRTAWTQQINLQAQYAPAARKGLTFTVDVINVLNRRGVLTVNESGETALNTPYANYLQPLSFQPPRTLKLTANYQF